MLSTAIAPRGMVTAPHHLASQAGLRVLQDGGNAIEAMVAAAATVTVAYPHMNAIGGDNFWLVRDSETITAIDACGAAAQAATIDAYRAAGHRYVPERGPMAALTVAGAVSGWQDALELSRARGGTMPLDRILEDAIHYARDGVPASSSLYGATVMAAQELGGVFGFADLLLPGGRVPPAGSILRNPALADTFERLAAAGLDDFYRGEIARKVCADLDRAGSPLALADFESHRARGVVPLHVRLKAGTVYNMPPPTQGLASLIMLGLIDRLDLGEANSFAHVHGIIEATKKAYAVRDKFIADPDHMTVAATGFLTDGWLDRTAASIDPKRASPWEEPAAPGDTVFLAAADSSGLVVSFIQSVYWGFGAGVVLPETGIVWQNRGVAFSLDPKAHNALGPGRLPFHTIQPAMAVLDDGRVMAYGTMGGDGQPQTQAAIYSRYVTFGHELQQAITEPRWILGRTWGPAASDLRVENRFPHSLFEALAEAGHDISISGPFDGSMGHAGAVVLRPDGMIEGAADPRADGIAAGW